MHVYTIRRVSNKNEFFGITPLNKTYKHFKLKIVKSKFIKRSYIKFWKIKKRDRGHCKYKYVERRTVRVRTTKYFQSHSNFKSDGVHFISPCDVKHLVKEIPSLSLIFLFYRLSLLIKVLKDW